MTNVFVPSNVPQPGYGSDEYTQSAREKIARACGCPDAGVFFLTGGTQTNQTVISSLLQSWQGVIDAETGSSARGRNGTSSDRQKTPPYGAE